MKTYGTCLIKSEHTDRRMPQAQPWIPGDLFEDAPEVGGFPTESTTRTLAFRFAPHVAIRFCRLFDGASANGDGEIILSATPSNLEDIDWFLSRYPVEVEAADDAAITSDPREWIHSAAVAHTEERAELQQVLEGNTAPREVAMALPPRDYQARVAEIAHRTGGMLDASQVGLGKQQPVDTPVLTPTGWRRIGDLCIGDTAIGSDGRSTRVLGVYPQGKQPSYRVAFSDGSSTEAGPDHLWTVEIRRSRGRIQQLVLTTDQLRTRPTIERRHESCGVRQLNLEKNDLYIPILSQPVQFKGSPLPVPAYTMGALIANGGLAHGQAALVCGLVDKRHIAAELRRDGADIRRWRVYGSAAHTNVCGILPALRALGIMTRSANKFIPERYQRASVADRIRLLHGLMDGDGSISKTRNRVTYHTISERLACGVRELVEGLGGIATVRPYDRADEGKPLEFQVRVRLPEQIKPFTLPRKLNRYGAVSKRLSRSVVSVEHVRDVESVCIAVDAPDRLYATEHAILTHNTISGITLIVKAAADGGLPALVVMPPHLMAQWKKELHRFAPDLSVHIIKTRKVYPIRTDVLICSYYRIDGWRHHLAGLIKTIVFDECAELRRNESKKYTACEQIARQAQWRLGASATPIYNYGGEFWNVMNVLAPDLLGTWKEFLSQWCVGAEDERKARLKDPEAFGAYLREQLLMVRWTRAEVARELPPLTRAIETIDIDESVLDAYESKSLELAKAVLEKQGKPIEQLRAAQELSRETRLATGLAKAPYVAEWVDVLCETTQEPIVLACWHRSVWGVMAERLEHRGVAWHTGSESGAKKQSELERFKTGRAQVLFMSLRSGIGVDGLQHHCKHIVFGELDWSPAVLEQLMGRLHRDGQREAVMAYYLLARDSMDQVVADALGLKQAQWVGVRDVGHEDKPVQEIPKDHIKSLAKAVLARFGRGKGSK